MPGIFKKTLKCVGLFIFLSSIPGNAQLLKDTTVLNLVKEDVDYIYNLQFDKAREVYSKIIESYPAHPIVLLLRGMMTYWENYPLLHTTPARVSYEEDMRKCIKLSEMNENPAYEAEYLLADLCARGMLLTYYADNDLIFEVIPLTTSTYKHLKRAFAYASGCTDLYYFTGVYKYYREAYPRIHPVYKSLALLFPPGDMDAGIKELQKAASSSVVLRAESYSMLTWIYLGFENNLPESLNWGRTIFEQYPDNVEYHATHLRNLLLMKKYDEAEKLMTASSTEAGNNFFQAQLVILKGILWEKKHHDYKMAQQYYSKGINDISIFGKYGNEYTAYAYFGLSRISDYNGEKQSHRMYRKVALKLADFKRINFDK